MESRLAFCQWSFVSQQMTKVLESQKKSSDNNTNRCSEPKTAVFVRRIETKAKHNDLYDQMIHSLVFLPNQFLSH